MFICPTCNKEFRKESEITKHFLMCWKEKHPYHQSKSAPRGKDIFTRDDNIDMINFLSAF